jgi:5'-phosphate synthase pdxT subunit
MLTIGVLALQGDFAEHIAMLNKIGVNAVEVRRESQLHDLDGLIIPGGESTTIAKLSLEDSIDTIFDTIKIKAQHGMPVYGTCMGSIFLAKEIEGSSQGRLGLMDIKVRRNAFGPQKFSREESLSIPQLRQEPFLAVFIRAPIILQAGAGVNVMARTDEGIVMARQGNLLVTAFHPEVTEDDTIHRYFVDMVRASLADRAKSFDQMPGTITIMPSAIQSPVAGN